MGAYRMRSKDKEAIMKIIKKYHIIILHGFSPVIFSKSKLSADERLFNRS